MTNNTLPKPLGLLLLNYGWKFNISTTEPVLIVTINYAGTKDQASPYTTPFVSLGPRSTQEGYVPYNQLTNATGTDVDDPLCAHGYQGMQFAAGLVDYNITTNRAVYELYKQKTTENPILNGSFVVFESYSLQGIQAIDPATTAYPHRDDNIIFTIVILYAPDSSLDATTIQWGETTRGLINEGTNGRNLTVYVNYAFGNETLESVYGYEPWRLEKLRGLKDTYDRSERFGYYMGIPTLDPHGHY